MSASDEVWILGIQMTKFGKHPELDTVDLAAEAAMGALSDAGVTMGDIGVLAAGNLMNASAGIGQQLQKQIGQTGIPVYNVANACATGATALRTAVTALRETWRSPGAPRVPDTVQKAVDDLDKKMSAIEKNPAGRGGGGGEYVPPPVSQRISTLLNAAYFAPVVYQGFFGKQSAADLKHNYAEAHPAMVIPLSITAIISVLIGLYPAFFMRFVQHLFT